MQTTFLIVGVIGALLAIAGGVVRSCAPAFSADPVTPRKRVERVATYLWLAGFVLLAISIFGSR